jgi:chorismate dehydratase
MTSRISASSYSNTAPLIWSFLYGSNHGKVELVLDNAPSRSAELLSQDRVDAALVPVIASQFIDGVKLVPNICVGARRKVRSVCLVTKGDELENVKSVSLDVSSRTSVVLTKIIFREFLGFEPEWRDASPDIDAMLNESDCALLIGDPALSISDSGFRISDLRSLAGPVSGKSLLGSQAEPDLKKSEIRNPKSEIKVFDLAEIWHRHTGFGFVFAMWMTRKEKIDVDLAAARDEGLEHLDEIAANYTPQLHINKNEMLRYLSENISYSIDDEMGRGLELYLELAATHKLIPARRPLEFI